MYPEFDRNQSPAVIVNFSGNISGHRRLTFTPFPANTLVISETLTFRFLRACIMYCKFEITHFCIIIWKSLYILGRWKKKKKSNSLFQFSFANLFFSVEAVTSPTELISLALCGLRSPFVQETDFKARKERIHRYDLSTDQFSDLCFVFEYLAALIVPHVSE